jgi:hypothetical protein
MVCRGTSRPAGQYVLGGFQTQGFVEAVPPRKRYLLAKYVLQVGLEPTLLAELDFKSSVSANSTTRAYFVM